MKLKSRENPLANMIEQSILQDEMESTINTSASAEASNAVDGMTSTRAKSRKTRVYVFREYLLQKYNDYLKPDDIVLDVAGGKGDLSWLLRNVDGIDSIVADPRTSNFKSLEKSTQYLYDNPSERKDRSIPGLPTHQPLAALLPRLLANSRNAKKRKNFDGDEQRKLSFESPRHLRILIDQDLVAAVKSYQQTSNREDWIEYWNHAAIVALQASSPQYKHQNLDRSTTKATTNNDTKQQRNQITDAIQALETIMSIKLIAGFHPDQATDACIDISRLLKIPFCVVPCCVFPKQFPNRHLQDGSFVRDYRQLIQYLIEQHCSLQSESSKSRFSCEGSFSNNDDDKKSTNNSSSSATTTIQKGFLQFNFTETAKNIVLYTLP